MDGPCPHAGVRTHRHNRSRGREGWQLDPADQSQVFPFPLPNPPPRYGTDQHHQWSPWRATGSQYSNPRIRQLELSSSHQLSGYYQDSSGCLLSICIRNLDTGEQQVVGSHNPRETRSLIVAPPFSVESKISHLSGNEARSDRRTCFHFN